MKKILIFTILLSLLAAVSAIAGTQPEEVRKKEVKTFDMKPGGRLILESDDGFIKIRSWNKDQVEVIMTHRAWAKKKRDAERLLKDIKIDIDERSGRLSIRDVTNEKHIREIGLLDLIRGAWDEGTVVDFELMVPEKMDLDLTADDGDIRISDVEGEFAVNIDDGDLTIEDCKIDRVEVEVDDGDIEIENVETISGDGKSLVYVFADDGNVFLRRSTIQNVEIEIDDGEVVFRDVKLKDLEVSLDDGDLEADIDLLESGSIRISVDDGDVDIDLLKDISAYLNLNAYDGKVRTNFPVEVERDDGRSWVREKVGNSDITIRIEVDNGHIVLNRR